jgi:hypothetical protein
MVSSILEKDFDQREMRCTCISRETRETKYEMVSRYPLGHSKDPLWLSTTPFLVTDHSGPDEGEAIPVTPPLVVGNRYLRTTVIEFTVHGPME